MELQKGYMLTSKIVAKKWSQNIVSSAFLSEKPMITFYLLSSYLRRINLSEASSCGSYGHHTQDLHHLLLNCPASESLWRAIFGSLLSLFDLWSRPCGVLDCWASVEILHAPIHRTGSGSTNQSTMMADFNCASTYIGPQLSHHYCNWALTYQKKCVYIRCLKKMCTKVFN